MKAPVIIARVVAGSPPGTMTLDKWVEWRKNEDARMFSELQAQLDAWSDMQNGETLH